MVEQITGDDGKATFQLEYGDYTATITKDGYQTVTENIAFRSNHKNFNIEIAEIEIGDYNYVVTIDEDTITGTLNIGEYESGYGYYIEIMTSSDPSFVTTEGMYIAGIEDDNIYFNGITTMNISDSSGYLGAITVINPQNVGIQVIYDGEPHFSTQVALCTEQVDWENIDWSKVLGFGETGGYDATTLIYEIDSTTHKPTQTPSTVPNGTYYIDLNDTNELSEVQTITVTDTNRSFIITVTEQQPQVVGN